MTTPIKPGSILVHSIGSGCHSFHEVISSSAKSVVVHEINSRIVRQAKGRGNWQSDTDVAPIPGAFKAIEEPQRLRIHSDGRIGPRKRMQWWSVWDSKAVNCFCS